MSVICRRCGYQNQGWAERCQNPTPLLDGSLCASPLFDEMGVEAPETGPPRDRMGAADLKSATFPASAESPNLHLEVGAGETVSCGLRVRNNSEREDEFTVEVIGDAAAWASVEPRKVTLAPGEETAVSVHFSPPRSPKIHSGRVPFVVSIRSLIDPLTTTWAHGGLEVGAYYELTAELSALEARSARGWSHSLVITSQGNAPARLFVGGVDSSGELDFDFDPPQLVVDGGQAIECLVAARPHRVLWWRQALRHYEFQIRVESEIAGSPPLVGEGRILQRSVLPVTRGAGLTALAAMAVVTLVGALVLAPKLLGLLPRFSGATASGAIPAVSPPPVSLGSPSPDPSPKDSPSPSPSVPAPVVAPTPRRRPSPPPPPPTTPSPPRSTPPTSARIQLPPV
jgi:hypothetical protein